MPEDAVESALATLEAESHELAKLAEHALQALTWDKGLEVVTQNGVQQYLWYILPTKYMTDIDHKREIAIALGHLLDLLGMARYAELCRSPQTMQVIEAWERDWEQGRRMFARLVDRSGLEPPDLDELQWGSVMGIFEVSIQSEVSDLLELAISSGEFIPGTRGWRGAQARIVHEFLHRPSEQLSGRTPLEVVTAERVGTWAEGRSKLRNAILLPILDLLIDHVDPPKGLGAALEPLVWLLSRVGEGMALTQRGNLNRPFVHEAKERFGWDSWYPVKPRGEDDLPALVELHDLARRIRAVRRVGRKLQLTELGRRCVNNFEVLWRAVCRDLTAQGSFRGAVAELALAALLENATTLREPLVFEMIGPLEESGWRERHADSREAPLGESSVSGALYDLQRTIRLLGMLEEGGDWQRRELRLTEIGRASAREALRAVAAGPRKDIRH